MRKINLIKSKNVVIQAKNNLIPIKIIKKHLNYIRKYDILVITLGNIEELLIIFVI